MVRRYDTTRQGGSTQLRRCTRSLEKSEWDQKMWKMECIFSCMIRWWDEIQDAMQAIDWGVSRIHTARHSIYLRHPCIPVCPLHPVRLHHPCISVHPPWLSPLPSSFVVVVGNRFSRHSCDQVNLEKYPEIAIERVWTCTWRPWLCDLGGFNQAPREIHLESLMERVWRCSLTRWSRDFGCALGGPDPVSLKICMWRPCSCKCRVRDEAVWRPESSNFRAVLAGSHWTACREMRLNQSVS